MSPTPEDVNQWLQEQHTILWMDWLINNENSRKLAVDWVMKFLKQMKELEIKSEQRRRQERAGQFASGVFRATGEQAPGGAKPEAFNSTSDPGYRHGHAAGHELY